MDIRNHAGFMVVTELRAVTLAKMRLNLAKPALSRPPEVLESASGLRLYTSVSLSPTSCGREKDA